MTEPTEQAAAAEQPLMTHLIELRDRLLKIVLSVLVIFLGLFYFANDLYLILVEPLSSILPADGSMVATGVASPFLVPFKLTIVLAIFLSVPFILHQVWSFIAPGLYQHEKKFAIPLIASAIRCCGAMLCALTGSLAGLSSSLSGMLTSRRRFFLTT